MTMPMTLADRLPEVGDRVRGANSTSALPVVLHNGETRLACIGMRLDWRLEPRYYLYVSRADGGAVVAPEPSRVNVETGVEAGAIQPNGVIRPNVAPGIPMEVEP